MNNAQGPLDSRCSRPNRCSVDSRPHGNRNRLFIDAEGDATGTDFQQTELPRRSVFKRKFDEPQVTTGHAEARGHAPAGVFDRGISLQAFTFVVDEGRTYGPAATLSSRDAPPRNSPITTTVYTHPSDQEMAGRVRGLYC